MKEKEELTYIVFSQGWDGMPIAYHLQEEGNNVIVAQIQDLKELGNDDKPEEKEDKEKRLSQYNGLLDKYKAKELVDELVKVENPDNYFIYFDQNSLWKYSEMLLTAGFTKGNFPTKADFDLEKGREEAMEFVSKNYPGVKIIPYEEFKTVDEAIEFLAEAESPYVVQSEGDFVSTVVPTSDDPEKARLQIMAQLEKNRKDYEKGGIILKEKLVDAIEITPQIIFFNGNPVFTDLDIETKNIGDGQNNGGQVGCGTNLVIKTDFEDKLNKIAFPKEVYKMAKDHTGIFIWDISLYFTKQGVFFGEFCANRYGYDALMTEMAMSGGADIYFTSIIEGKNPLKKKYGTAVRLFNLNKQEGASIEVDEPENVWFYEIKDEEGQIVSVGNCWDLGVATFAHDELERAVDGVYNVVEGISFKELYKRVKQDFLADYPTSIMNRLKYVEDHKLLKGKTIKDFFAGKL